MAEARTEEPNLGVGGIYSCFVALVNLRDSKKTAPKSLRWVNSVRFWIQGRGSYADAAILCYLVSLFSPFSHRQQ